MLKTIIHILASAAFFNGGRHCRKARESPLLSERYRLFGVLLRRCAVPTDQVVYGLKAGSLSQDVRIGRPLSYLQHLTRYRPGTIGIAKSPQTKVQEGERT